jgi:hypothetical protein
VLVQADFEKSFACFLNTLQKGLRALINVVPSSVVAIISLPSDKQELERESLLLLLSSQTVFGW